MANDPLVSLRESRERAIAVLSDLFSRDEVDLDEFERRITLVHRAGTVAEVDTVTADLPAPAGDLKPQPSTALVPVSQARETQSMTAVLGGVQREGTWTTARRTRVIAVLGGAKLDFREARVPTAGAEVKVFALMSDVKIIVPPELAVDIGGAAILGGFEHLERTPLEPDPERPVLRVHGFCMLGSVSIETRLPGESERQARRRRRRERKERRRLPGGRR